MSILIKHSYRGCRGVRDGSQVELFVKGNPSLLLAFVNAVAVLGQLGFYSMTSNMFLAVT